MNHFGACGTQSPARVPNLSPVHRASRRMAHRLRGRGVAGHSARTETSKEHTMASQSNKSSGSSRGSGNNDSSPNDR